MPDMLRYDASLWGREKNLSSRAIAYAAERILRRIDTANTNNCWIFPGSLDRGGYGKVGINHVPYACHRVMYCFAIGPIPTGMLVLHRCDNRACCNPNHLFLGSHQDNTSDMIAKGRAILPTYHYGERHCRSKLTNEQIREIRIRFDLGEKLRRLGRDFGVSKTQIKRIVTGASRKNA